MTDQSDTQKTEVTDAQIIKALGGPAEIARLLDLNSRQTAQAWMKRGIPSHIKLRYSKLISHGRRMVLTNLNGKDE